MNLTKYYTPIPYSNMRINWKSIESNIIFLQNNFPPT